MIIYICTDTFDQYRAADYWHRLRGKLEEVAKDACLLMHYSQVSVELLARIQPWALCHSGGGTDYDKYDVLQHAGYRRVVREFDVAQIGFCGGHQIINVFHGGRNGAIRRLRPGEPDLSSYNPGYFKEIGVYPVRVVKADPIFKGLPKTIRVHEYHYHEVKKLGAGLELLASSAGCRVQAFRHRTRPVYGVQFHPEQSPETYPDGTRLLQNFFRIARQHMEGASSCKTC